MRTLPCFLIIFLLALVNAASAQPDKQPAPPVPDYAATYKSACEKYNSKDYKECIKLLTNYSRSDTAYADALDVLALAYLSTENWDSAVVVARRGLGIKSSSRRNFYEILGAAYDSDTNHLKAIGIYEKGLVEFPEGIRFYHLLAMAWMHENNYNKAVEYLQQAIKLNPFYAASHYQLGVICMNNNLVIPAILSFQTFLIMEANTKRSIQALTYIEKLSKGEVIIPKDSVVYKVPASTNNFDEIQAIVDSRVAIDNRYKTEVKLPYTNVVKQMQVIAEKISFTPSDSGFWMQFYVPFYRELWSKNYFNPFAYYIFSALNEDEVQKQIKKNKSDIDKMASFAGDYFAAVRNRNWNEYGLSKQQVFFNDAGNISSIGYADAATKNPKSNWKFYYNSGNLKSAGALNEQAKNDGEWMYYFPTGEVKSREHYRNDLQVDSFVSYYTTGAVNEQSFFVDNKVSGLVKGFYTTGALKVTLTFVNGERTGPVSFYYENGLKEFESSYLNGKFNGAYVGFYDNGRKKEEFTYTNDKIEGHVRTWHSNGKLKSEGEYKSGNIDGEWTYYSTTGKLEKKGAYKVGKEDGVFKEYFENGGVDNEVDYSGGKPVGTSKFYSKDGKIWSTIEYAKGNLKKFTYYDKSGNIISECSEQNDEIHLRAMYSDGVVLREGVFKNGLQTGEWKSYSRIGVISTDENYEHGALEGLQKYYDDFGNLHREINFKKGVKDGLTREYNENGVIVKQGWFVDGKQNGDWLEYYSTSKVSASMHFIDDELNGYYVNYDLFGKVVSELIYDKTDLHQYTGYDTLGHVLYDFDVYKGGGKYVTKHLNGKKDLELFYKYGALDGEIKEYYANGNLRYSQNYKNAKRNGSYKTYLWDGTLLTEGFYKDDEKDSLEIRYDAGKKEMNCFYSDGNLNGKRIWYFGNGRIEIDGDYVNGDKEGYFNYFDEDGSLQFRILYENGFAVSYSYLKTDSTFIPEILLPLASGTVKSFYKNGNPSAEFTFSKNKYEGAYKLFHSNGMLAIECSYFHSQRQGVIKEYYSNGALHLEKSYIDDMLNGAYRTYSEKGVIKKEYTYLLGNLHGPAKIYDATGKLSKSINFNNDEPYE